MSQYLSTSRWGKVSKTLPGPNDCKEKRFIHDAKKQTFNHVSTVLCCFFLSAWRTYWQALCQYQWLLFRWMTLFRLRKLLRHFLPSLVNSPKVLTQPAKLFKEDFVLYDKNTPQRACAWLRSSWRRCHAYMFNFGWADMWRWRAAPVDFFWIMHPKWNINLKNVFVETVR